MGRLYHILDTLCFASILLVIHWVLDTLQNSPEESVFGAVHSGAIGIVGVLFYYPLFEMFRWVCCYNASFKRLGTRPSSDSYQDFKDKSTEIVRGLPKLTMESVWILVYGLGFIFFVCCYSFSGMHQSCYVCLAMGLSVTSIDEILQDLAQETIFQKAAKISITLCAFAGILVVSIDGPGAPLIDMVLNIDMFSIVCGVFLPFLSCVLLILVKDQRRYTLGTVYELCEFGLPFTCILAVIFLVVSDGQNIKLITQNITMANSTDYQDILANSQSVLSMALGMPLLYGMAILMFMANILHNNSIDPLLSLCLVGTLRYLQAHPNNTTAMFCFSMVVGVIFFRIITIDEVKSDKVLQDLSLPNMQLNESALDLIPDDDV